jgi:hypothetical protein
MIHSRCKIRNRQIFARFSTPQLEIIDTSSTRKHHAYINQMRKSETYNCMTEMRFLGWNFKYRNADVSNSHFSILLSDGRDYFAVVMDFWLMRLGPRRARALEDQLCRVATRKQKKRNVGRLGAFIRTVNPSDVYAPTFWLGLRWGRWLLLQMSALESAAHRRRGPASQSGITPAASIPAAIRCPLWAPFPGLHRLPAQATRRR